MVKAKQFLMICARILLVSAMISIVIPVFLFSGEKAAHYSGALFEKSWGHFAIACGAGLIVFLIMLFFNYRLGRRYYDNGLVLDEQYFDEDRKWNPFIHLVLVFVNCMVAFYMGFLVGGEAPGVLLGASVGMIVNVMTRGSEKQLVQGGMSASLCVTHMNPLAGLAYLFEEQRKRLNLKMFLYGIPMIGIAYGLAFLVRRLLPYHVLHFEVNAHLPPVYYILIFIMVILAMIISKIYLISYKLIKKSTFFGKWMDLITLLFGIMYMLFKRLCPVLTGSGVEYIGGNLSEKVWWVIAGILLFRTVNTAFSFRASVSGGVVLPIFALGSIMGDMVVSAAGMTGLFPDLAAFAPLLCFIGLITTFAAASDLYLVAFTLTLNASLPYSILPAAVSLGILKLLHVGIDKWLEGKLAFLDTEEENRDVV